MLKFRLFCLAILFFVISINFGCSTSKEKKEPHDCIMLKGSLWVKNSDYMSELRDAVYRQDKDYIEQLILEGKVYQTDKDVPVIEFGIAAEKSDALIQFKEGRYSNKTGVTLRNFLLSESQYQTKIANERQIYEEELKKKNAAVEQGQDLQVIPESAFYDFKQEVNLCLYEIFY